MPLRSTKRGLLYRFASVFGCCGDQLVVDCHQDSHEIASAATTGPSRSAHPSTRPVPDIPLPVDNSTPDSQPPIGQSRSKNDIVVSSEVATTAREDFRCLPRTHGGTASLVLRASGLRMGETYVHTDGTGDRSIDGWELLMKNIAPSALYDSSARFDAPKCDEDTRVEVTGEIMDRIQDRSGPQRILCMTGAAGAGKSALQQTIAERCANADILGATFFFSSADPTRNGASTFVGTIAYQLGLKHPLFQSAIDAAVTRDPLIFTRSIQSQMEELIVVPFKYLRSSKEIDINTFPYAILIDGLDECKGPNYTENSGHLSMDRVQAEDRQAEILAAIRHCILNNDLPFRIFIASRPEWAIRTALQPGGHLHQVSYHIQLSDKYDVSRDMYRYLQRRFDGIGLRIGNTQWFTQGNINTLVEAASGQFAYVATVYRYISEHQASPGQRLKSVLLWTPQERQRARPFEALDQLYTNILLAAKNAYEAFDSYRGRDFLLLFRAHHISVTGFQLETSIDHPADRLSALLCLESRAEERLISDLRSLVTLETDERGDLRLRLYHKSFSDFLQEESRTKDLFVSESRVVAYVAKWWMQHIIECPLDFDSLPANWEELPLPVLHRRSLKDAIEDLPFFLYGATAIDGEVSGFTQNGGWRKINSLMPLLYHLEGWAFMNLDHWIDRLGQFAYKLKTRKPEDADAISQFVKKWKHDMEEWRRQGIRKRI